MSDQGYLRELRKNVFSNSTKTGLASIWWTSVGVCMRHGLVELSFAFPFSPCRRGGSKLLSGHVGLE